MAVVKTETKEKPERKARGWEAVADAKNHSEARKANGNGHASDPVGEKDWKPEPDPKGPKGLKNDNCKDCRQERFIDERGRCYGCNGKAHRAYLKEKHAAPKAPTKPPATKNGKEAVMKQDGDRIEYLSQIVPVKMVVQPHEDGKAWKVDISANGGRYDGLVLSTMEVDRDDEIANFGDAVAWARAELATWERVFVGKIKSDGKFADAGAEKKAEPKSKGKVKKSK